MNVKNMITSGIKTLTTAFKNSPVCQATWFGKVGNTTILYPYGTLGNAPTDSQMVMFSINAEENKKISIEFSLTEKPPFLPEEGEYICGNFVEGNVIYFRNDGTTLITGNVVLGSETGAQPKAPLGDTVTVEGIDGTITAASLLHKAN